MSPLLLAAAFAADLLLGDPRHLPHPVVAIGRLVGGLERLLYARLRPRRLLGELDLVFGHAARHGGGPGAGPSLSNT